MKNNKKIIILIGDGMADYPLESLGNRTPLEAARTPHMDFLARNGTMGLVRTVPEGMHPGSDVANLSIFGYDPKKYFTGRAPLEALSMEIGLSPSDAAFRCNIVTIRDGVMKDFSGGHIDSEYSRIIIGEIRRGIGTKGIRFYPGVSYRNIMVWENYPHEEITGTTPPHDFQEKGIESFLPQGAGAGTLVEIMEQASRIIAGSRAIQDLKGKLKGDPVSLWLWGGGRRPGFRPLREIFGLYGHTISAVDLIHGIGRAAGLEPLKVPGATGYIDTNYRGKAEALLGALGRCNFIFLHVESPDESGHEGNLEHKIRSIEDFDDKVVGPVLEGIKPYEDCSLVVMPDHPTPLSLRTHTADPVPFLLYHGRGHKSAAPRTAAPASYSEKEAANTGIFVSEGHTLIPSILKGLL